MFKCLKCDDVGYVKAYKFQIVYCDCPIGIQLQLDYDKADEKYHAQTMDVEEGTAQ